MAVNKLPGEGFRLRIHHKLSIVFILFTAVTVGGALFVMYDVAKEQVNSDIRKRLRDIVGLAATTIDADLHDTLRRRKQEEDSAYVSIKACLGRIRDASSDIKYIYTLRKGPQDEIIFMVDAEEKMDDWVHLGTIYHNAGPSLVKNFNTLDAPLIEDEFYTDEWGTWLSGYAPFYNRKGERVGILGVDIAATKVMEYERHVMFLGIGIFCGILPLIVIVGFYMGKRISRPIVEIQQGAERIGAGNLDSVIEMHRSDEIGSLADSFNEMTAHLKQNRLQLEEMANKYRGIFENASEGIFQSELGGQLLTANVAMAHMLGYDSGKELCDSISADGLYVNQGEREHMLALLNQEGRIQNHELIFKRKDGGTVWVELSAHLIREAGGATVIEGIVHDISERLEREKAERERQAAELASQAKSEFLANMSHEIRTPMNAVIGMTDLALRTPLTPKQKDYLTKIRTSSRSLLGIINDILDFSKIEAGKLSIEHVEFQLQEVIENTASMVSHRAAEKGLELLMSIADGVPCSLRGDPLRLGQVLLNLANNAVKFTQKGEVALRVELDDSPTTACGSADATDKVRVRFTVSDSGIGIENDKLDMLFESFTQADGSTTRKFGGTGLGLAITKRLVEMMEGRIEVSSEVGKGSVFVVHLEIERQEQEHEYLVPEQEGVSGLRVLVADDNDHARDILSEMLESFRFHVETAASGDEALSILRTAEQPFDLVLMDWKMPGLDGVQTTRRIREESRFNRLPLVIMVTAYGREDVVEQAKDVKINEFLDKPVNPSHLFDTIIKVFGKELAQSREHEALDAGRHMDQLAGARLLLVEDLTINRQVAQEILENAGMVVDEVENGQEAVDALRNKGTYYDAVLMDVQMPVMDGLEASRYIRDELGLKELPIIAMTAHAMESDRIRCLEAGMNEHVAKPIDANQLYIVLARFIDTRSDGNSRRVMELNNKIKPTQVHLPENLPGLDISSGVKRVQGNTGLYVRLLKDFQRDFSDSSARMEVFMAGGENDEFRRSAHAIKGVAANIGAEVLHLAARDLEAALKQETGDNVQALLDICLEKLHEVLSGLEPFLQQLQEEKELQLPSEVDLAEVRAAMREFAGLLDQNSFMVGQALESLEPLVKSKAPEIFDQLAEAVNTFNFTRAREQLDTLAEMLGLASEDITS